MERYWAVMKMRFGSQGQGLRALAAPLSVGLLHFLAAAVSLTLTRWSSGLASIWLPNAILLAFLLIVPRRQWWPASLAVLVSGTIANAMGGAPLPLALLFGTTNALEPLGIALLMGADRRRVDLERIQDLLRFVAAAVLIGMISATAAAGAGTLYGSTFAEVWASWLLSSFLGLAIMTPILLIGFRGWKGAQAYSRGWWEAPILLAGVALFGAAVFALPEAPLFFTLQPLVLIATFRLRGFGAAASVLVLAALGTVFTVLDIMPANGLAPSFGQRMATLQAFLAVSILTALPVAALLSERDRFSRSLAQREAQLASIVDAVSDVIFRTDPEGRWTYLNPAWEQLTGQAVEEAIGRSVLDNVVEEDREEIVERLRGLTLGLFDSTRHQFRFRNASGEHRWGEVQAYRLVSPGGEMTGAAGIIVDISDRLALAALAEDGRRRAERDAEAALLLAATDELTGVASRRAFLAVLDQQLTAGEPLAIALFDIDHFKQVNDRYGHGVGDEVLQRVAALAESSVRDRDVVGRLGGEEFAVLMPGATVDQAAAIGERLRKACADAFHPPGIPVTVSLGVSASLGGESAAELLRQADTALYQAKYDGRNCLRLAA
jgi:diguanylate cyclase (GGDEF)-like protein/PAS domain S-box-containing protein